MLCFGIQGFLFNHHLLWPLSVVVLFLLLCFLYLYNLCSNSRIMNTRTDCICTGRVLWTIYCKLAHAL